MPLNLDSCIAGIFVPGNIGASSGLPPIVRVVPPRLPDTFEVQIHEVVTATATVSVFGDVAASIMETAHAVDAVNFAQVYEVLVGEVANATDAPSVSVSGVFAVTVVEAATAASAQDASVAFSATITEAATAASAQDASVLSWVTTHSKALINNSTGWAGYNIRQVIGPAELAFSGSQVRVTLRSAPVGGFVIDHAAIGHAALSGDAYDFDGGQVALTFSGGNAGVTVGINSSILSDEITFSLDKTKVFIVAAHFSGASATLSASTTSASQGYYKSAASEVLVSNVSAYSLGLTYLVSKIEVK